MAQATLEEFLAKRRQRPRKTAPDPQPQAENQKQESNVAKKPRHESPLASFKRGNPPDPDYLKNPANRARHERALERFGPKPTIVAPKRAYKPLELQFVEMKTQYPDTLLLVEVGFRYRAWAQDAAVAARICGFKESNGWLSIDASHETDALYDRFATFSFPTHRIAHYVQKLVNAGCKVGVVGQSETTAIKKSGSDKSGPFKRDVTAIYTKGTFINDFDGYKEPTVMGGAVIGIYEPYPYVFAICSVDPSTGEIIHDHFKDTAIVTELETRLLHLEPSEIIQVGQVSQQVLKLIEAIKTRASIRVESTELGSIEDIPAMAELDKDVQLVISCMARYLRSFKMENVFALQNNYTTFNISSCMYLDGNTLNSLEIFQNSTDFKAEGSLFSVMDRTMTRFGKRLFRKWVAQPLVHRESLEQRVDAVQELIQAFCKPIQTLRDRMKTLPDLERYLLQIHYGRITRKQLYECLYYFHRVCNSYTLPQIKSEKFKNPMLCELLAAVPSATGFLEERLQLICSEAAREGEKITYFHDKEVGRVAEYKAQIKDIESRFQEYIETITGFDVKYVSHLKEHFFLEVKTSNVKKVPENWQKMSATKTVVRFRSPETFALIRELDLANEQLEVACDQEFIEFTEEIKESYTLLRQVLLAISQIDCLMSLAGISAMPQYTKVDYVDEPCIEIIEGRHPVIEARDVNFIPNDVKMYQNSSQTMIITGPNMGGKSSYVRQCALIVIMAQVGAFVPARKARICMVDAIFTRMGAYDNMIAGESTFQVELKECANILAHATPKSLVLLDEIGRGTSTVDGVAIAYAVLDYIVEHVKSFTLFITHYPLITELCDKYDKNVTKWCMEFQESTDTKLVTFLYRLVAGVAHRSYGINVARLANLPEAIIEQAEAKSRELELHINEQRCQTAMVSGLKAVLEDGATPDAVKALLAIVEAP